MAKEDDAAGDSGAKMETGTDARKAQEAQAAQGGQGAQANIKLDPIELLKADHRLVEQLFQKYETANGRQKSQIIRKICSELIVHTMLEEEIFYPACREQADDEEPLDAAQVEHDSAKVLILDLLSGREDEFRDAKVKVLSEQIKHHVAEEEAAGGIFAKAKAAGLATPELGSELQQRKRELQAMGENLPRPKPVALQLQARMGRSQEEDMPRQDRDERGRFTSDDDDRRGRSYAARGGGGGGRSYRDDEDDGRGWYGDSRGHAEAARRGWEGRRGESRSFRNEDDDDRRYSSRGNDRERDERGRFMSDDDDRGGYRSSGRYRDRDERGRFTEDDDRGYRSSSRYRDDDDGRGWYGDSRGHAEAARKGWETRRDERDYDDDDDRRGYRSRGRDYDDDDRGRDRGQGGWFGDRRGHAEAARRGWENRR